MACTEIYLIRRKSKVLVHYKDIANAAQGALYIWFRLEEKYLPSLPLLYPGQGYNHRVLGRKEDIGETELVRFWGLPQTDLLSDDEKLVMESCSDHGYIPYKDLPRVANAFRNVDFVNDHMRQHAAILDEIYSTYKEEDVLGVYSLETSVISISDTVGDKRNGRYYLNDKAFSIMDTRITLSDKSDQNTCTSAE